VDAYFCARILKPTLKLFSPLALLQSLLTFCVLCFAITAHGSDKAQEGESFKAGPMIVHHIADAHSIHIVGDVSIPLPCIVHSHYGWDVFMSSVFMDDHHESNKAFTSKSGATYVMHHEKIFLQEAVDTAAHVSDAHEPAAHAEGDHAHDGLVAVSDFSITKSVFGMFLMGTFVVVMFISAARAYNKRKGQAPKGLQNFLEPLVLFIKDEVAVPALGKKRAQKFLPFLLTSFFFIWACNLLGLIPFVGGFNITGTLGVTLVLAVLVFIITTINGNAHYWGHIFWPPGVPLPIKFILVPIEVLSIFMKPAVLMIRLVANINAGHIIILAFTSLIFIFGEKSQGMGYGVGVFSTLFMIFMFLIELLVAFLQAYVFTLLAAIYFGDATQEHHHAESH